MTTPNRNSQWRTPWGRAAAAAMILFTLAGGVFTAGSWTASRQVTDIAGPVTAAAFVVAFTCAVICDLQARKAATGGR